MSRTNTKHHGIKTALLLFFVGIVSPVTVLGQSNETYGLEEIIVTAQKREQSILEVPISITAFSEADLKDIGADSFEDYARFVPNLSFVHRGEWNRSFQPNVRGVQLGRTSLTTAFYIDETPLQPLEFSRTGLPDPNMFDVNRVEVLKGPQGTLYGASAMGGAIKVVPNRPDSSKFEARIGGDLSQYTEGSSSGEISGMINIPVVEGEFALRVIGTMAHDGGYIKGVEGGQFLAIGQDSDFQPTAADPQDPVDRLVALAGDNYINDSDFQSLRILAEWTPNERLTLRPSVMYQTVDEGHGRMISGDLFDASGQEELIFPVFNNQGSPVRQHLELYTLTGLYETDRVLWTGSASIYSADWNRESQFAGTIVSNGVPVENIISGESTAVIKGDGIEDHFIFELRGDTNFDGIFNGTAGIFYREVDREFNQISGGRNLAQFIGGDLRSSVDEDQTFEEIAVFGQLTITPTDKVEISAGLRWYDYERVLNQTSGGVRGGPSVFAPVSEDGVEFSASGSYFIDDKSTVYARVGSGYRPGFGDSIVNIDPSCRPELIELGIDPDAGFLSVLSDELINYEIGWKSRFFDNRLSINAAAYLIEWEDIQIDTRLDECAATVSQNAGKAEIMGFEVELRAELSERLSLSLALGHSDSELTEDAPAVRGEAGEPLPEVSEITAAGSLEYAVPLGSGELFFRGDVTHADESLYSFRTGADKRTRDIKEALTLGSLRAGVRMDEWTLSVYSKNVTNELQRGQCRDSSFTIPGERHTCANEPRTVGVRFDYTF